MKLIFFAVLVLISQRIQAQHFFILDESNADAKKIILENYTSIELKKSGKSFSFDKGNLYTFLVTISDSQQSIYEILYQTDFFEQINFLAISSNMTKLFKCEPSNMFSFFDCVSKSEENFLNFSIVRHIINCVIKRLNDYSNK
jgi:hypothetical protein